MCFSFHSSGFDLFTDDILPSLVLVVQRPSRWRRRPSISLPGASGVTAKFPNDIHELHQRIHTHTLS